MARRPRHVVPGQALHLIQRGNNRQAIFFADGDYQFYYEALQDAAHRYQCAVHAYVFMTNHVHLLLTPSSEDGPSRVMQSVGRRYVRYVNTAYRRTGTLWEGRFKSAIVDSERYLLVCSHYIEMNPIRAGMVSAPQQYRWTSYRGNAQGQADSLLSPHDVYQRLGQDLASCREGYRQLFERQLDVVTLGQIRLATETGAVIGNDRFRDEIELALNRRVRPYRHGGDRKSKAFRDQEL